MKQGTSQFKAYKAIRPVHLQQFKVGKYKIQLISISFYFFQYFLIHKKEGLNRSDPNIEITLGDHK